MITETTQNVLETDRLMTTIGMKKRIRIGAWNIRTLIEPSRLNQLCSEFVKYNLLILGLSETRWPEFGEVKASNGLTFLYSGKQTSVPRSSGVGFLLSKEATDSLIDWEPHSDRIITARFQTRARKLTCIQCYAPTELAEVSVKEEFYSQLDRTMSSVHHGDIMILMGDFNAQVGSSNINLENVMGRHGVGSMNRNGELFTEMCAKYNMVIGGTLFPHRTIHKVTWMSPDHVTENQIDHMAISKKWRGSLLDVRNKRGADISSDHHLLVGTIRIKLAAIKNSSKSTARKFDVVKLSQAPVAERYVATLQAALENNNMINRNDWEQVKCTFLDAADKHLGHCQHQRKPWMSELTWQLIEDRKSAKGLLNSAKTRSQKSEFARAHSDLDKQVKRSARRDKRAFTDGLAKEAQAAAATNRTRDLYRITKKLTTKSIVSTRPLKNSSGELVTSKTQQLEIWTNHYTELLKTPSQPNANICNCSGHTVRPDISTSSPSVMEVTNVSARLILQLIEEFWRTKCLHDELKEGIIVKVSRKGNLTECNNWRRIKLLSMVNKVVAHIITDRYSLGTRTPRKSCKDQE